ncbi:MAG: polysaccharide biosynthesis protein [Oscillospiraceae bacterium]|nr:polysaccharide biosynthesis protein [Oscillospiraceae bacterium]
MWRFASYNEVWRSIKANLMAFIPFCVLTLMVRRMPISYYLFGLISQFVLTLGIRFIYRFYLLLTSRHEREGMRNRVLLIGAGSAGQMIIRDVINGGQDSDDRICAIIDDNPNKWGRYIESIKIVGGRESIFTAVEEYRINKIFFAIPSASAEDRREILNICSETGCELRQLPGMTQIIRGEVSVSTLKEVAIEDLLGREPIKVRMDEVFEFLHGKTVLVTGGGGSIGSEICRQVAAHEPRQLIIFDVYENNAYDIQLELRDRYPELNLVTLIGSVRDSRRIDQVFARYHPDVVYHAAAHKHVPLMEDSPCESVKNNAIGTYKTAYAAMKHGCSRFVLISTDKAVNPTNIMGASKRLCEMVVQSFARKVAAGLADTIPPLTAHEAGSLGQGTVPATGGAETATAAPETQFVAVRFGNVLGSNGSVVPLFKKQIAKGGPVTVTHPDIIRYFMTVPEAVSLVLQAGTYAHGGEIFVLDMGSPVKIDTLARNIIRLSGLKPDVDIKIEYTGLRPGEKLYEEKLMAEEGLEKTANNRIHIGKPLPFDTDEFFASLSHLMEVAYSNDEDSIRREVSAVVPTYHYEA